jgi:hypothetical protein
MLIILSIISVLFGIVILKVNFTNELLVKIVAAMFLVAIPAILLLEFFM